MLDVAFRPDRAGGEPLYRQLEDHLRALVETGRLPAGERLPATRELAASLGLGRNTVAQAYEALCDDGLLMAHVGQGTFVAPRPRSAPGEEPSPGHAFAWEGLLAARTRRLALPESASMPRPIRIDFRGGGVDAPSAPQVELRRAYSRALARHGTALAEHRDPMGWPGLREAVARALVSRGIGASPDEVMITGGAQQALDLVGRCLVDPGDAVVIEQPGYFAAGVAFAASGAHLVGVDVDDEGLRTADLARLLRSRRVKLVYVTPAVQCPSGVVMSDARREELLALADEHQTPVVEDDYDSELRVGAPPRPALKTRDPAGQVIYVGTFSKAVLPGLRIGYLVAPAPLLRRMALARVACDLGTSVIGQAALAELLEAGDLERHVRRARRLYAARLALLDEALAAELPQGGSWSLPAGGNTLWLRLPPQADPDAVWRAMQAEGIAAPRGDLFFVDGRGKDHFMLGVAGLDEEGIAAGAAALGRIVKRAVGRRAA
jgi:GntR family transcriptional regulator/MocR family aminotransferase